MDYSKMSDFQINMAVHGCLGLDLHDCTEVAGSLTKIRSTGGHCVDYCNNPADAWQIIQENGISINHCNGVWEASFEWDAPVGAFGTYETVTTSTEHKNPLRAAMVAYLMMREVANVQTDSTR